VDTAGRAEIDRVRENIRAFNPKAKIIEAVSPLFVEDPRVIENKRVLVIEDGPTLTHGEMGYGAATLAAEKFGAREIVDPRPYAVNSIAQTFKKYPHMGKLLPAMGYGEDQIRDLAKTIRHTPCDAVVIGTPIDLQRLIKFEVPATRVRYELQEIGHPTLKDLIAPLVE
ncbi:MAG: GTPase, partial [Candidatus Bipolaricaulota bacterium]|nr:GTPase [Candidatus Bipolaricaulota bacterium]